MIPIKRKEKKRKKKEEKKVISKVSPELILLWLMRTVIVKNRKREKQG